MKYSVTMICLCAALTCNAQQKPWMNKNLPVAQRVEKLMKVMTVDEKIGQMAMVLVGQEKEVADKGLLDDAGIGAWLGEVTPAKYNEIQRLAEKTRLQIPYLMGIDAHHGNALTAGCTVFPTSITMASTFNPDLEYTMAQYAAAETRATGSNWTMTPCAAVVEDARWGRTGETFGECPFLVSSMVGAAVRGYQGNYDPTKNIACTANHFIGSGYAVGGVNHGNIEVSERRLRSIFMPPFKAAIAADIASIMPGHNDVNGIPIHCNKALLNDLIKDECGFKGFYITDMGDVENLLVTHFHRVAANQKDAVEQAFNAGLDMHMYSWDKQMFIGNMKELVKEGKISMARINDAVRRILTVKFKLGLFENRYIKETDSYSSQAARDVALEAARQGIVLLKNDKKLLPLQAKSYHHILVTGPNANNQTMLGDWSAQQPDKDVVTVLQGVKMYADSVVYVNSGGIKEEHANGIISTTDPAIQKQMIEKGGVINDYSIGSAVDEAKKSDLAIVVIGGNGLRYEWGARTYGESADRPSIDFYGRQVELVQRIAETGVPVIVVMINGKTLNNPWITANIPAIVEAWEPGMYGGEAVADVLFGKVNPSGKLPITVAQQAGQMPMYYYQTKSRYVTGYHYGSSREDEKPAFCFGHGLSYTTFGCSDADVADSTVTRNKPYTISAVVSNTGTVAGYTTVMAFVNDELSSVVTPLWMMCGFKKVWLEPNEKKTVRIDVPFDSFKLWNREMKFVAEPGYFNIKVGFSFDDVKFTKRVKL
jgi:beta-glucosidase